MVLNAANPTIHQFILKVLLRSYLFILRIRLPIANMVITHKKLIPYTQARAVRFPFVTNNIEVHNTKNTNTTT